MKTSRESQHFYNELHRFSLALKRLVIEIRDKEVQKDFHETEQLLESAIYRWLFIDKQWEKVG